MQDEIVARLAGQLGVQLIAAEARRAERVPQPGSMDLYFRGMACLYRGFTPGYMAQARGFFERALALDPGNIEALVYVARVDFATGASLMTDDRRARLAAAEAALTKVLSLAPEHPFAHYVLGGVHIQTNRVAQGIAECERALALDRNLAIAHAYIGVGKCYLGRAEETESHVNEALRLSPRDTLAHIWMHIAAFAKLMVGADEEAVARFRRSLEMNPNYPIAQFYLATALAHLGRLEEAHSAARAGLALDSAFTLRRFRAGAQSNNPTYLAQRERLYDGMRKAGVPEG
jgi:tetratricopeptide (TPR) repeat protein